MERDWFYYVAEVGHYFIWIITGFWSSLEWKVSCCWCQVILISCVAFRTIPFESLLFSGITWLKISHSLMSKASVFLYCFYTLSFSFLLIYTTLFLSLIGNMRRMGWKQKQEPFFKKQKVDSNQGGQIMILSFPTLNWLFPELVGLYKWYY